MRSYPQSIAPVDRVEPVPRRIRAVLGGTVVVDTVAAVYVWESVKYPHYYLPVADLNSEALSTVPDAVRFHSEGPLAGLVRIEWAAMDAWYEEDEQVFVHPRSPYVRVDALRSTRSVRVELDGLVVAESAAPVMVFETGLPTRYYLERTQVNFEHLVATDTQTACPYKGVTSGYWSISDKNRDAIDVAWSYDFPTRQLLPIAGLIAFYNEKVDLFIDGKLGERSVTDFSQ